MRLPQNRALAGVGKPMKPIVCLSSRLNLASLSAEKAAMRKARKGVWENTIDTMLFNMPSSISRRYIPLRFAIRLKSMAEGATPKVTTSASESSSLPIGELTPKRRALMPSKKSKTAPAMIAHSASI